MADAKSLEQGRHAPPPVQRAFVHSVVPRGPRAAQLGIKAILHKQFLSGRHVVGGEEEEHGHAGAARQLMGEKRGKHGVWDELLQVSGPMPSAIKR